MRMSVAAVCSWCLFAYVVPVAWLIVWSRRHADPTPVIQEDDWEDEE